MKKEKAKKTIGSVAGGLLASIVGEFLYFIFVGSIVRVYTNNVHGGIFMTLLSDLGITGVFLVIGAVIVLPISFSVGFKAIQCEVKE